MAVVVSAYVGYKASKDQNKAIDQSIEQQYKYDSEKYIIEAKYRNEQVAHSRELSHYGDKQLAFAYDQKDYAGEVYKTALANARKEQGFRDKEVFNKKMSATVDYNAQAGASQLMVQGAIESANNAISETMRTGSANMQELERKAGKELGATVARTQSGITGGASRNRELIAVRMERNRAVTQLEEGIKASMIQTTGAKEQLINDNSLKVNEAYRGLQAMLELESQPVAAVQGPQPVFTEKAPIGPVTPLGPPPMKGVNTSGGDWAAISAGVAGARAGISLIL